MSGTDDRADGKLPAKDPDPTLPVTAEVGGEGGSYADATLQAEGAAGVFGNPRVDPTRVAPVGAEAGEVAPEREAQPGSDATVTPASEPPDRTR